MGGEAAGRGRFFSRSELGLLNKSRLFRVDMDIPQETHSQIRVNARQAFLTIAKALDYVGVDDIHHAHRVAYIAYECGKVMSWSDEKLERTFYAGLLHDCGVVSSKEHVALLAAISPVNTEQHCIRGYQALKSNALLSAFAPIVRYHHTPWSGLKDIAMDRECKEISAMIHLADRVDFLRSKYAQEHHPEMVTLFKAEIGKTIGELKGHHFEPNFVDAMLTLVQQDGFWFSMNAERIEIMALEFSAFEPFKNSLNMDEITDLALFLANLVDAKSPFTYQHSQRVARISQMLAVDLGFDDFTARQLYVAGLLHDVGKLRTPDEILYKEGHLEGIELSIMKRHTTDTLVTLGAFLPNSKVAQWAANHHEKLDGSGYPFNLTKEKLDTESRIIAVADIFQALTQNRPYRASLSIVEIFKIMDPLIEQGKLDAEVYSVIANQSERYYQAALVK